MAQPNPIQPLDGPNPQQDHRAYVERLYTTDLIIQGDVYLTDVNLLFKAHVRCSS